MANPVQDNLHFTYETVAARTVSFEIYSTTGKLLAGQSFDLLSGQNRLDWDIQDLPNGTYWVKEVGQGVIGFKIVKQ